MVYKFNKNTVTIPEEEIKNYINKLDLTEKEAIDLWLEDNGYQANEEQSLLDKMANQIKISRGADGDRKTEPKPRKPREIKTSDEKKQLFHIIYSALLELGNSNVEILKENKAFQCKIGGKLFKVDIIEHRQPKN